MDYDRVIKKISTSKSQTFIYLFRSDKVIIFF